MSKERFEIFGKIIKDNEEVPNLLDNYLATVRLNEFNEKVKELEQDRDTWKRACELACQIIISGYCDGMEDTTDWESAIYQWKEDNGIETYGIGVEELLGYLLEQAKTEK